MPIGLMNYNLDIEWLITWFPHRAHASTVQQTRVGFAHFNTETFVESTDEGIFVGQGTGNDDPLHPTNLAIGWITVGTDENTIFSVTLEIMLGKARRVKSIYCPPGAQIPFMINLAGKGAQEVVDTSLSLHGTIKTGNRPVDSLRKNVRLEELRP